MRAIFALCFILALSEAMPEPEAGLGEEHLPTLSRLKRAGACTTTADCVAGNVCSKWGWCQWTSIYGSDGPSQGSSAPGGGKAGQCVTSADCASRVPYCSKLGYCHGGRLPFDEAQLEIPDEDKTSDFPKQPQGFINNDPAVNNPAARGNQNKSGGNQAVRSSSSGNKQKKKNGNQGSSSQSEGRRASAQSKPRGQKQQQQQGNNRRSHQAADQVPADSCPGGSLEACTDACVPIKNVNAYGRCVTTCGKRC